MCIIRNHYTNGNSGDYEGFTNLLYFLLKASIEERLSGSLKWLEIPFLSLFSLPGRVRNISIVNLSLFSKCFMGCFIFKVFYHGMKIFVSYIVLGMWLIFQAKESTQ